MELDGCNGRLMVVNGKVAEPAEDTGNQPSIVFPTKDPNINLRVERLQRLGMNLLHMKMEVVRIPEAMARDMAQKKRFW